MSRDLAAAERMLERVAGDARRLAEDAESALRSLRDLELHNAAPVVLDAAQAAALTGLSVQAIYRLARANAIPCVRIGTRGVKFHRATLDRWLADGGIPTRVGPLSASLSARSAGTTEPRS